MLEGLDETPPQIIMQVAAEFAADQRANKIDLGIGVYRAEDGTTPILQSVHEAEQRLLKSETTKSYLGPAGDPDFNLAMSDIVLGRHSAQGRVSAVQTPGGSGALRLLFDLINRANPEATIWLPDPSWANHAPTLTQAGLRHRTYRYFDSATLGVDFDAMRASLALVPETDVVLFHGCCHNPTGADLSDEQWDVITQIVRERKFIPLVDIAYQGFANGLEEDAYGVRSLLKHTPEMFIASSCSKNFAIYRERTGMAIAISANADIAALAMGQMRDLARVGHSMPPDHGAAIVRTILRDPELTIIWKQELEDMRLRISEIRKALAAAFRARTNSDRFDFLATHRGMFSLLGITPQQVGRLRDEHAVYMVSDSRMNVAGLRHEQIGQFVDAVLSVID